MATRITNEQMRKIYATAKEIGLDNDLLHTFVFNITGMEHISAITKYEAMDVIDKLKEKKAGEPTKRPSENRASEEQINKIRVLERELGWSDNPKRLIGFMRKFAKTEKLIWLTPLQASNLIDGLKAFLKREREKAV